ncbi:MAG: (Fe-S)-binding protein [Candidatus Lambdaproteobacteria bacterium]|nr:(Fe-S)-binding protein [Candidatus Lambdaproteobacteria bacterium]
MAGERAAAGRPAEVYFFGTCLVDLFYPEAGLAAVELIEREGVRVIYPQAQTCCGQPAYNSGYRREARRVAAAQLPHFAKPIPVVVPSGSCAAMLHGCYPPLFAEGGTAAEAARARDFAGRVVEWSTFLAEVLRVRLRDRGAPVRVAYHPSCHLLRELGVREAPLALLGQLAQVELAALAGAEECCGFGGTFSVKQADISGAMLADKARAVVESGATVLLSLDAGCLLQIGGALAKAGHAIRCLPLPLFLKERTA